MEVRKKVGGEERKELARLCWEELREKVKGAIGTGEWEREKREYYEEKGWSIKKIEEIREKGELRGEEIIAKEREAHEKKRWEKIRESRFNK